MTAAYTAQMSLLPHNPQVATPIPAIIIVEKINNYLCETVFTTVITRQYTVQMVVTNRKLPIRRCCDPTMIMAGTVIYAADHAG